jgi:hypothetical protein
VLLISPGSPVKLMMTRMQDTEARDGRTTQNIGADTRERTQTHGVDTNGKRKKSARAKPAHFPN